MNVLHLGSIYFHTIYSCLFVFPWNECVSAGSFSNYYVVTKKWYSY